jgi:hypothetical protein
MVFFSPFSQMQHYLSIYLFMALQPSCWDLGTFLFLNLYTADRTPWMGISPSQGRYLDKEQHTFSVILSFDVVA